MSTQPTTLLRVFPAPLQMALKFLGGAAKEGFAAANALIGKVLAPQLDVLQKVLCCGEYNDLCLFPPLCAVIKLLHPSLFHVPLPSPSLSRPPVHIILLTPDLCRR